MFYSDDPVSDFDRYDAAQNKQLSRLPECVYCERPIQDDFLYLVNDEFICESCLENHFKKPTDNYIE